MTNLFTPIKVGPYELTHRVVLAPTVMARVLQSPPTRGSGSVKLH